MSSMDQLPPEREIPSDRYDQMRRRLLRKVGDPTARRVRTRGGRPAIALATGLMAAAIAAVTLPAIERSGADPENGTYALGDSVLSEGVRAAGRQCLKGPGEANEDNRRNGLPEDWPTWPPNEPPTLLNHIEQPGGAAALVIYRMRSLLFYCSLHQFAQTGSTPGDEVEGGRWAITVMGGVETSPWLPGSVSIDLANDGSGTLGDPPVLAGRVSERVAQVVLDDGAGLRTVAKIDQGTFVVFGDRKGVPASAVLITYDVNGAEIDRQPGFEREEGRCYVDPGGNLVNSTTSDNFNESGKDRCRPAEPWSGRSIANRRLGN